MTELLLFMKPQAIRCREYSNREKNWISFTREERVRKTRGIMGLSQTLLFYVLVCVHLGVSQHYLRLRPSPSDHLPVPDLKEDPDPEYDPREQDLAERTLRKKLGSNFDPNFMSISPPMLVNLSASDNQVKLQGPMPNEIKKLDLTETPYGKRVKVGKKARRKFLQWLWTYTHCPVVYTWKDLGVRFWPRYIKEGNCFSERSCSFPEGMSCKPVKSINKIFLRWYCQGFLRQKYCTWIQVQYPIISECKCSCWFSLRKFWWSRGEWTENTVSIALLTLYRGGHHSKSIFLYSILSEIPTLYIFKKNAAIFSNWTRTIFYSPPWNVFLGEHEHFRRKSFGFFWYFYETLKMECICYTSPRGELFSTEHWCWLLFHCNAA